MADDWLKVCKNTIDKPEIGILARSLGVSVEAAFGYWFRVYVWADGQTRDGFIANLRLQDVATLAKVPPDVCRVLASDIVRWMVESNGDHPGVMFRNWDRHNGKCAKRRGENNRRQAKCRAKSSGDNDMR